MDYSCRCQAYFDYRTILRREGQRGVLIDNCVTKDC